jgi:hypothetical protein
MGFEMKGADDVAKNFEKFRKMAERNMLASMKNSGEKLLKESNDLAPKDTGNMTRQSDVHVADPKEVEVRYNEDYALFVHEDLEARHPKGGQAKFLQTATNNNGKKVIKKLSEDLLK